MIFELRGRTKDDTTAALRKQCIVDDESPPEPEALPAGEDADKEEATLSMDEFWDAGENESFSAFFSTYITTVDSCQRRLSKAGNTTILGLQGGFCRENGRVL